MNYVLGLELPPVNKPARAINPKVTKADGRAKTVITTREHNPTISKRLLRLVILIGAADIVKDLRKS